MPERDNLLELTDPRQMRALAHPLRLRLLGMLRIDGPATATVLADEVDESTALVSYHLRSLASHGFIHEAPELARDGRERWWRASHPGMTWDPASFLDTPERAAAAGALLSEIAERYAEASRRWLADAPNWPPEWVDVSDMSSWLLKLNPQQVKAMHDELVTVIGRYEAMTPAEGAEAVQTILQVLPRSRERVR